MNASAVRAADREPLPAAAVNRLIQTRVGLRVPVPRPRTLYTGSIEPCCGGGGIGGLWAAAPLVGAVCIRPRHQCPRP
jgi:hypothetical protein